MTDLPRAHRAWRTAERIRRISDGLVGVGPFKVGVDGVISWLPWANIVYDLGVAGVLLVEGVNAGAKRSTLIRMAAYLAADSASSGVPILGWAFDTVFRGHAMAARALQKDVEARFGPSELPPEPDRRSRSRRPPAEGFRRNL